MDGVMNGDAGRKTVDAAPGLVERKSRMDKPIEFKKKIGQRLLYS